MGKIFLIICLMLLVYTRFVGIDWGLPYPMHPDERNIVVAVEGLVCDVSLPNISDITLEKAKNCLNPKFYAYGQPTIYLSGLMAWLWRSYQPTSENVSTYTSIALSLRAISAIASILLVGLMLRLFNEQLPKKLGRKQQALLAGSAAFVSIFSPYAIQFSHFGTTEAVLMLLYTLLISIVLKIIHDGHIRRNLLVSLGLISGLAVAIKLSSVLFLPPVFLGLVYAVIKKNQNLVASTVVSKKIKDFLRVTGITVKPIVLLGVISMLAYALFSPHNLINFSDFMGSISYETNVANGTYKAFYTRQFEHTIPYLFQVLKVFPYALGWPQFILAVLGFLFLPWNNVRINVLRLSILLFLIPTGFLYAKWSRFLSPIYPLMTIMALLFVADVFIRLKIKKNIASVMLVVVTLMMSVHGYAYLAIYQSSDVRFEASKWIYDNIPDGAHILSETANVVDIPILPDTKVDRKFYSVISFDYYHLDENEDLQFDFRNFKETSEYLFVPSRRVFSDHTCLFPDSPQWIATYFNGYYGDRCDLLNEKYPILNVHYRELFSDESKFKLVHTVTSYPRIEILGATIIEFPDEHAEETWTVFDHPVIRVYKKI